MAHTNEKAAAGSGWLTAILIVVLLAAAVFVGWKIFLNRNLKPMDASNPETVTVTIPSGSGTRNVSSVLYHAGLIRNSLAFMQRAKQLDYAGKFKAGEYTLNTGMSVDELMAAIVEGPKKGEEVQFTIIEGKTVRETLESLAEQGIDTIENLEKEAEFGKFDYWFLEDAPEGLNRLEGFLMPDTYRTYKDEGAHGALNVMLKQFNKIFSAEFQEKARTMGYTTREMVTIASLIEAEAGCEDDRPLIASVIYNRIAQGMKLQIDATIYYCFEINGTPLGRALLNTDYTATGGAYDLPYNTYRYKGLPAGPICSPRKTSVIAALNPADTDYIFYVLSTKGDGSHVFAVTYAEHEKNVDAYIKWRNSH